MNSLIHYIIEANLYLISFYLLYQLILVRDKHFRFNRAFLLGAILLSMSLPLLSINLYPAQSTADSFEGYIMLPAITITEMQTESVGFIVQWWHIIGIIYLVGVAFYLSRLAFQMAQIVRKLPLLNSSRDKKNGYTLVTTDGEIPTCSFFKYLFWDKSVKLAETEKQQIFQHELAHIRQWHSIDVIIIELLRALFWFNPVAHLIKSRITEVHEYLADDQVTKSIHPEEYSRLLTLQIFRNFNFALSNNFHKSQVIKRIKMLKAEKGKSVWLNISLLVPTLALLITVLACNVDELQELNPAQDQVSAFASTEEHNPSESGAIDEQQEKDIPKEIFTIVENAPLPNNGMGAFYKFIQENLNYPDEAKQLGIEGKVFV
jgi:hypothetical protein